MARPGLAYPDGLAVEYCSTKHAFESILDSEGGSVWTLVHGI
jgi:hypothetical protein